MSRLSASGLERATECPASTALPVIKEAPGEAAQRGIAIHAYLEGIAKGADKDALLKDVPVELRALCESIDTSHIHGVIKYELGVVWDSATGKAEMAGEGLSHGDIQAKDGQISGIIDLAQLIDDHIVVIDYKTGRATPARRSHQLRFLAMALAKAQGVRKAKVANFYIRDDGTHFLDDALLDGLELDAIEEECQGLIRQVDAEKRKHPELDRYNYKTGPWCRYCPSFNYCEPQTKTIRLMAQNPHSMETALADVLASNPAEAYRAWQVAKDTMRRIEMTFRGYAQRNPIQLEDGKVYGERVSEKEVIDAGKAIPTMARLVGMDDALAAAKITVTKKAINDVARVLKLKMGTGTIKAAADRILNAIAADGGITRKEIRTMREFTPGAPDEDE